MFFKVRLKPKVAKIKVKILDFPVEIPGVAMSFNLRVEGVTDQPIVATLVKIDHPDGDIEFVWADEATHASLKPGGQNFDAFWAAFQAELAVFLRTMV